MKMYQVENIIIEQSKIEIMIIKKIPVFLSVALFLTYLRDNA